MRSWPAQMFRARWALAVGLLAVCAALGWQARRLATDPSNSAFLVRTGEAYRTYQEFRERFGSDQTVVVGVQMEGGLSPELVQWMGRLTEALRALPHVEDIRSLSTVTLLEPREFGKVSERSLVEWLARPPTLQTSLPEFIRSHSVDGRLLLNADGTLTMIVLHLNGSDEDRTYQHQVVRDVRRVLTEFRHPHVAYLLTGTSVEQDVFVDRVARDRRMFVPVAVLLMAVLLAIFHGTWQSLAYAGLVMTGAFASTEGLMALSGTLVNPVTVLLAPIILVVAVGYTVQLSGAFPYVQSARDPTTQMRQLYRMMFVPCLLAMLTTVIGFLSLLASEVPAERGFAWFGAFGTLTAWVLAIGLAPLFLSLCSKRSAPRLAVWRSLGKDLARWAVRYARLVVAAACVLVAVSTAAVPQITRSTDLLHTLKPADDFRQETERLQHALGGVYPLELMLEFPQVEALRQPASWLALERFQRELSGLPLVSHVFSLANVMAHLKPLTRQEDYSVWWLARVWEALPAQLGAGLSRWLAEEERAMRMSVYLRSSDTAQVVSLADEVQRLAAQKLPDGWHVRVTGMTLLLARMSQRLVHDELSSLGIAFGLILGVAWVTLRSWPYALMTVVPNALPIGGLFGLMAWWRIPLNTATAMIASVALGLIFDNTIYVLYRYREARALGTSVAEAIEKALARCLHPVLTASLILAGGFAVTIGGHLLPTVHFGLLTCATIGLALVSDVVVLPALLAVSRLGGSDHAQ